MFLRFCIIIKGIMFGTSIRIIPGSADLICFTKNKLYSSITGGWSSVMS